jgi:hypothetical protein
VLTYNRTVRYGSAPFAPFPAVLSSRGRHGWTREASKRVCWITGWLAHENGVRERVGIHLRRAVRFGSIPSVPSFLPAVFARGGNVLVGREFPQEFEKGRSCRHGSMHPLWPYVGRVTFYASWARFEAVATLGTSSWQREDDCGVHMHPQ